MGIDWCLGYFICVVDRECERLAVLVVLMLTDSVHISAAVLKAGGSSLARVIGQSR